VAFLDCFDQDKPETKAFIERFKAEYKTEPFSLSAYGYDTMYIVKAAIESAGAFDREKIRTAFEGIHNYKAVLGAKGTTFEFGPNRHAGFPDKGAVIRLIENNHHGRAIFSGY
jgi:branched-chain amino acid transport system substrate-binding protein